MTARFMSLLLGGALLAGSANAQEHAHRPMQSADSGRQAMPIPMQMQMMMPGPAMMLELREPLRLTPQQVQRIEAIQARVEREQRPHGDAATRAIHDASTLLDSAATPDLSRYEATLREAADHFVQAHLVMARGWVEARGVLTPEQRSNLQFGMRVMEHMMQGQMSGMMNMPSMMQMHGMMGGMRPGARPDTTRRPPGGGS